MAKKNKRNEIVASDGLKKDCCIKCSKEVNKNDGFIVLGNLVYFHYDCYMLVSETSRLNLRIVVWFSIFIIIFLVIIFYNHLF